MLFAILLGLTIARTETANLPSYFPKCYQDDPKINECFVNAANSLNQYVRKGIPEIGLRPLDPFVAPPFTMTLESPITDYNATLRGFTFERLFNYQFISAEIRPKDGVVGGKLILPDLDLKSNYTVEGHIINLPLQGGGYFKIANSKIVCDFLTSGWQEKKNCNGINLEITCKIEDLKVNITGLANDMVGTLLNLSSQLVASELSPAYTNIFRPFLKSFLTRMCRKHEFDDLFPLTP